MGVSTLLWSVFPTTTHFNKSHPVYTVVRQYLFSLVHPHAVFVSAIHRSSSLYCNFTTHCIIEPYTYVHYLIIPHATIAYSLLHSLLHSHIHYYTHRFSFWGILSLEWMNAIFKSVIYLILKSLWPLTRIVQLLVRSECTMPDYHNVVDPRDQCHQCKHHCTLIEVHVTIHATNNCHINEHATKHTQYNMELQEHQ